MTLLYTEGSPTAPLILVGEAPGESEQRTGRPFVGPAGDLLNDCLHQAGITRQECYITNVLKFRPPGNDGSPWTAAAKKQAEEKKLTPAEETKANEFSTSKSNLLAELESCTGCCIAALGETAMFALLTLSSITKRRGSVYELQIGQRTCTVVPVLHPAAALRTYVWRNLITWDLLRVRQILRGEWKPANRTIWLRPSFAEAMQYLTKCSSASRIGFDVEVVNEELNCFAVGLTASDVMCIPLRDESGDYFSPDQECQVLQALSCVLDRTTVVGQNLNFDYTFMLDRYGMRLKRLEDTMIAQAILYPDLPKGLDMICSLYTAEPYYKDEGKQWKGVFDYPKFWLYNAKDVAVCLEAWPELESQLRELDNWETYQRQRDTIQQLAYMQHRGLRMNAEGMKEAARESTADITKMEEELARLTGIPDFNANSPKQVQTYFYITKGLEPYKKRGGKSKGAITTDENALKRIAVKGFPEARLILDIRQEVKARGYYAMNLGRDGRLRCAMNPVGTVSGRFSSSQTIFGEGSNMQNQPKKMKKYMLADEGCFLIQMDLAQAENRIVAVLARDEQMLNAFAQGIDIHTLNAATLLNKPVDQISREAGTAPVGPRTWSERDLGKRLSHGLNYGLSYVQLALQNEITEGEAKRFINIYHSSYPRIRGTFHEYVKQELRRTRVLRNCFNRSRIFIDRIDDDTFRKAFAHIPSSTVADIINEWGLNYIEENSQPGYLFDTIEFMNQIHDAVLLQAPLANVENVAVALTKLVQSLEQELKWNDQTFRIPVDVEIGLTLGSTIKLKCSGPLGQHCIEPDTLRLALEELHRREHEEI